MEHIQADLRKRIRTLEDEFKSVLEQKERAFRYRWEDGKVRFEAKVLAEHRRLRRSLASYIGQSRLLALLTAPVIYSGLIPFVALDIFLWIYQRICFPVYGVPRVARKDFLVFDRGHLKYLNILERLNCIYCSYANGMCAYVTEVAARTEQHWCPIKHARRIRSPHSRYGHFLDYGNAEQYREGVEAVRSDFVDVRSLTRRQTE